MRKNVFILVLLSISFNLMSQFYIGSNGGVVIPVLEESRQYNPTLGINGNIYYNTKINLMIGLHYSYFNNMNLSDGWVENNIRTPTSNNAYLKFEPTISFSLQYLIYMGYDDISSFYFGFNFGQYTSSASGKVFFDKNSIGFYGEKHKSYFYSPKIGLNIGISERFKINLETKYDILNTNSKENLFWLSLGMNYVFITKK